MRKPMHELLNDAKARKYGIAAPNCFNFESIQACFEAAHELQAPIILDVGAIHDIEAMSAIVDFFEKRYPDVIFALNLDHGSRYEDCVLSIKNGFTSVMMDRSTESFEKNVKDVQEVVRVAHAAGISVEAELGHVGVGQEYAITRDEGLTDVAQAIEYVSTTNIDCLAVAVGTSHGTYAGEPYLDFNRLEELVKAIDIPLVLHGGSSTGDENLYRAVKIGVQKINLFTDLGTAWLDSLRQVLTSETDPDYIQNDMIFKNQKRSVYSLLDVTCRHGYKKKLMHYMKLFESTQKAL